jgi:hypothetical protein
MPITDVLIKGARPSDKALRLFDGGGLYLEVMPNGSKYWRLKYRYATRPFCGRCGRSANFRSEGKDPAFSSGRISRLVDVPRSPRRLGGLCCMARTLDHDRWRFKAHRRN